MASAKNNQLISSQGPHFSPRSTAKTRPIASLAKGELSGICHLLSIQQVYSFMRGMVSHMQVLATPSSTVHNTKYLDPYH